MKKNNYKLLSGLLAAVFLCVSTAAVSGGQTSVTWARESAPYNPANEAFWNEASNWSPQVVPNNNGGTTYGVTIQHNPASLDPVTGPRADMNIVLDNLNMIDRGIVVVNAGLSLTVLGTTTVDALPAGQSNAGYFQTEPGATITLGTLTSYDPSTQTQNFSGLAAQEGIIKYHGANIVTSNALLYLIGPNASLRNQDDESDAIANLAVNNSTMICLGHDFSSAGDFTNNSYLKVGTYYALTDTTFTVSGNLTNYNPATNTLSGGIYKIDGHDGAIATLRFADADIRQINATLEMEGDSQITDLAGNNAFRNLAGNSGTLQLSGNFTITPDGGTFSNTGTFGISSGASVTVAGDYSQTAGSSTTVSNGGSFTTFGTMYCDNSIISLGTTFGPPLVTTASASSGFNVTNFSQLTGTGTAFGDLTFTADSSFMPGHSAGQVNLEGNLTMDSTCIFGMEIGGLISGEEFDLIAQTGSAFTINLGGSQLVLSLIEGFENSITNSDTFDIITSENPILGSFGNVASGERLGTADGRGSFRVTYSGQNAVTLSDFLPPPQPAALLSRKMHGAFQGDLSLPLSGTPGVEPRSGGASGIYQMIIAFPSDVIVSGATLSGIGTVDSFSVNSGAVTVNLSGVTSAQTIVVTLVGVDDGVSSGNVSVSMRVLLGDVTRNGVVNGTDVSQVKSQSGHAIWATSLMTLMRMGQSTAPTFRS